MSITAFSIFEQAKQALPFRERSILDKAKLQKSWITLLTSKLPQGYRFVVQRQGCETPIILVSSEYFIGCASEKSYNGNRRRALEQFNHELLQAMHHAVKMSAASVFLEPSRAVAIREGKKRAKLESLRDAGEPLPDKLFMVQYIAVVTEIATPERKSIAIQPTMHIQTPYELAKEGKRILSEQILNDDELRAFVELEYAAERNPIAVPSMVTIAARNGSIETLVSYDALGGNLIPLDSETEDDNN